MAQYEGTIKQDQANIENAKLQLTYAKVTAPITGVVGLRLVDPGNIVHASDANGIVVITQLQPISVLFTIPEDSLPQVTQKLRAGVHLPADAYNRDNSKKLASGTLVTLDNQIDSTTGTSQLKAVFDNKDNALFPQQFVNIRLLVDTLTDQLVVPNVAIQNGQQGTFVYVVDDNSRVHLKPVQVGITTDTSADILSGISEGDRVVIDGTDRLIEGAAVRVRKAGELDNPGGPGEVAVETAVADSGSRRRKRPVAVADSGVAAEMVRGDAANRGGDGANDGWPSSGANSGVAMVVAAGAIMVDPAVAKADTGMATVASKRASPASDPMSPSRTFILRPVATSLMMLGVVLVGVVAFRQLPVSALPQVDYPTMQVQTFYPGASPEVVTSSITAPLEKQFGQVPGLTQMTSISSFGSSLITLQFSLDLSIDIAEQEVQAAINSATSFLPTNLPVPPVYSKTNPADAPILTLAITSTTVPLPKVEELAETRMAQRISQLQGVGLVSISGGQRPAVRVRANPTALASYGLSLETLRTALASANVNQAKGNFDGPDQAWTINDNDQLQAGAQYGPIIIAYRNGAPVRVSDVATVIDGAENTKLAAWVNADPAIVLNIQRQPGTNIISVVDTVQALLPQIEASLPEGIHVQVISDRTTTIRASVKDVEFELLLTTALVVMVIFLFLRSASATIIPGIAVPLSLVGTFAVMYLLGYSLDNLSLMALTISTGFVVDDAIVMIENISRYIEMGESPMEAALKGSAEIGFTIVSLTVSLIAVLIPLLFMADIVGRLFREFAVTLAVTIIFSAFVSLTLTPMMAARILKHHPEAQQGRLYRWSEWCFEKTIEAIRQDGSRGAASSDRDAARGCRHARPHHLPLRHRSQGVLSRAGYRRDPGHFAGARDRVIFRHVQAAAGSGPGHPPGSGR